MDIRTLYLTSHKARPFMARPIIIFFLVIATSTSLHKPLKTIFEDNSEKMWIKQDELKVNDLAKNLGKENLLRLLSTMLEGQSQRMWKRQDDLKAKHLEGQVEDLMRFLSFMEENLDKMEEEVIVTEEQVGDFLVHCYAQKEKETNLAIGNTCSKVYLTDSPDIYLKSIYFDCLVI